MKRAEQATAWHNDCSDAQALFGSPIIDLETMIRWNADRLQRGLPLHHKRRITKNARATSDALPPDSAIPRFDVPATILHAGGCRRELGTIVRGLGGTRVLVVTDPGVVQLGAAGEIVELLTAAGASVASFDAEIDKMAADALASGSPDDNPRIPTKEEIGGLYREAW